MNIKKLISLSYVGDFSDRFSIFLKCLERARPCINECSQQDGSIHRKLGAYHGVLLQEKFVSGKTKHKTRLDSKAKNKIPNFCTSPTKQPNTTQVIGEIDGITRQYRGGLSRNRPRKQGTLRHYQTCIQSANRRNKARRLSLSSHSGTQYLRPIYLYLVGFCHA